MMATLSSATSLHIPVQRQLLFEARERIYTDTRWKIWMMWDPVPILQPGTLPGLQLAINKHPQSRTWTFELYVSGTDVKLMEFIVFSSFREHVKTTCHLPPNLQVDKKIKSSLRLLEKICSTPMLEYGMQTLTGSAYLPYTTDKYPIERFRHLHFDVKRSKRFPSMNHCKCLAGSYRSQGHAGDVFHTIEYGPPYLALVPLSRDKWQANDSGAISVTAFGKTGEPSSVQGV